MKKNGRRLSMALAVVMAGSIAAFPASAAGYTNYTSIRNSSGFGSAWEKTRTYKKGSTTIGYMVYGYNTDWIKEDYVWTKATECYSTAMVYRDGYDTKYCEGPEKGKNIYSKIEVTHRTYYVNYKVEFSASYSGVTYTTSSSSIK